MFFGVGIVRIFRLDPTNPFPLNCLDFQTFRPPYQLTATPNPKQKNMECKSCGASIEDTSSVCPYCKAVVSGSVSSASSPGLKQGTGGKLFKVYAKGGQTFAVKQGWSWPAFFFSWIWAFTKSLFVAGSVALLIFLIAAAVGSGKGIEADPTVGDSVGGFADLILVIVFGAQGNKWWEARLLKNGFALRGEVRANNPTVAIAQVC